MAKHDCEWRGCTGTAVAVPKLCIPVQGFIDYLPWECICGLELCRAHLSVLDARALRSLLEAVPVEKLTTALKTASESLRNHIFTSMSKRASERIKEDMEIMGGVRLADVEAAQREIVEVALRLDAEGTISLENKNAVV